MSEVPAVAFLEVLIPDLTESQYIEIRSKGRDGAVRQVFAESAETAWEAGNTLSAGAEVWFGVGPRARKRGTREDVAALGAVWADLDFKLFDARECAEKSLERFLLEPSIVVSSGGGLQPYWVFEHPLFPDDFKNIEDINRGLAAALGPEGRPLDSVGDAARVLRLPGTINHKYSAPRPVEIVRWNPQRRYRLEDWEAFRPAQHRAPAFNSPGAVQGVIGEGERNTKLTSLAGSMRRRGMTKDEIAAALLAVNSSRCTPPLDEPEVLRIAESVSRYALIPFPSVLERRARARSRAML